MLLSSPGLMATSRGVLVAVVERGDDGSRQAGYWVSVSRGAMVAHGERGTGCRCRKGW